MHHQSKIIILVVLFLFGNFSANANVSLEKPPTISFSNAEILSTHSTRIPFKLVDHLIVIEAELLDKKGNFIIDTGSETLILNSKHFKNNGVLFNSGKETSGVIDVIDNPAEKHLSEFLINDLLIERKTSDVIDLSHIEVSKKIHLLGIIGFNILKDYEIFVDMYLNQITLSRVDRHGEKLDNSVYLEEIIDTVAFDLKKHTIVLDADINGETLKFGLDTAAEFNQLNKRTKKKVLKYFYPSRRIALSDASGKEMEVLAGKLFRVKLSDTIYCAPMETVLTNLSHMNEVFGTELDGVIGYEFLKQQRTIINYKKEQLYFIKYPIQTH
ncbi:MAG: hypothetical protein AAF688_10510 [Bacteroidota bacterium]